MFIRNGGAKARRSERRQGGKLPDFHKVPQAEINALLVRLARAGQVVARLKGGDPLIFGRGSEEAEALYLKFRGRMPGVEALLKGRGLLDAA